MNYVKFQCSFHLILLTQLFNHQKFEHVTGLEHILQVLSNTQKSNLKILIKIKKYFTLDTLYVKIDVTGIYVLSFQYKTEYIFCRTGSFFFLFFCFKSNCYLLTKIANFKSKKINIRIYTALHRFYSISLFNIMHNMHNSKLFLM